MQRKRPSKVSPLGDLIASTIIGAIGAALIVIGTNTWHPLIFVGAILVIVAFFISGILH